MEVQQKIIKQEQVDETGGYLFLTQILDEYFVFLGNLETRYGMNRNIQYARTKNIIEANTEFDKSLKRIKY
jgi:hypothetical protein